MLADTRATAARAPLRSSFTRLAILIALAASLCVAALFGVTRYVVLHHSDQTLLQTIDGDLAGLVDIFATSGKDELIARLQDRMALAPLRADQALYLLADAAGERIAGNLESWPILSAENSEIGTIEGPQGQPVLARATQIAPDLKLVVGRSLANARKLDRNLILAFGSAGLCVIALAVGLGLRFARRTRARIQTINKTFYRVSNGALNERSPVGTNQDEIDELSCHTNDLLDRVADLLSAHRNVTDHTAHEIRTPLMHLDSRILQVLKQTGSAELTKELSQARHHIKRIVTMLDSLLDIAANEAHKGSLFGLEPLDFSHIAHQVVELFSDSAEDMGIAFFAEIEDSVTLRGDRMQLSRLISNLLDNAFKYCGENGQVVLRLKAGPVLMVSDSGPGVPDAAREAIFNRFERISRDAKTGTVAPLNNGHGLGLSLARAIAERHGLTLTCPPAQTGAIFLLQRP